MIAPNSVNPLTAQGLPPLSADDALPLLYLGWMLVFAASVAIGYFGLFDHLRLGRKRNDHD